MVVMREHFSGFVLLRHRSCLRFGILGAFRGHRELRRVATVAMTKSVCREEQASLLVYPITP